MLRSFLDFFDLPARAEAMRRMHSAWLTKALQRGSKPPRIPTRKVADGGWSQLTATPEGEAWAREFWEETLEHPETQ
jgi:hypothetical protein